MRRTRPALPRATWIQRLETSVVASFGVSTDHFLDRDVVLTELAAHGSEPEQLLSLIDPVDIALARWLGSFEEVTRRTYDRALRALARDMALPVVLDARSLLRRAADKPDAVAALVRAYVRRATASTGTLRLRLTALRRASQALCDAGLAKRAVDVQSPADTDVDLSIPSPALIAEVDATLERASQHDSLALRTRAEFLLATEGLRAHEICQLDLADVRLSSVLADGEVVRIAPRTSKAIRAWLQLRGTMPGPLFVAFESKLRGIGTEPISTRALERDVRRASRGRVTLRALRRCAVVTTVNTQGWSSGERVARLTRINGVTRMVNGARESR